MDGKQFDALARSLAGLTSRRVIAGGFASGVLGAVLPLVAQPVVEARRKKNTRDKERAKAAKNRQKDDDNRAEAEKKRKKRKVTLCHSGQTITVSKKAKKKHLKHGDTLGPCPDTPGCVPDANACAGRECGSVDNGCGVQVACGPNNGGCPGSDTCNTNTGTCGCTPDPDPCAGRECGSVDNGCGTSIQCGPNNGSCSGTDTCNAAGQCVCNPDPAACDGRDCGSVDNGCGQQITCGSNNGACAGTDTCNAAGQCVCTPVQNPCAGRECGTVDNGCGTPVVCGDCTAPEICDNTTGQCGCTPIQNPCAGRECGSVDDGCGVTVQCGPNDGACSGTDTCNAAGQCVCTPIQNPCAGRECGSVQNGCGQQVTCGSNDGACPGDDYCNASGQCLPAACQDCNGCCTDEGTCVAGNDRQACGYGSGRCEACNPGVACVNGGCTCSNGVSCGQGCCTTDQQGRPFCDNSKRPCGNTCIAREACCTGIDSSSYQSVQPGCLPNETCAVNGSGFGECRCGTGGRCQRNQGCCTVAGGQTTCDTSLRPCGDICIPKEQCCSDGQATAVGAECDDGISCTSVTCVAATGTGQNPPPGICVYNETAGTCAEACAAGYGYGNQFPEWQREVRCGSANGQRCYCWRTTEDENTCTEDFYDAPECRSSADCANGRVCIRSGLTTGSNRCAPICQ